MVSYSVLPSGVADGSVGTAVGRVGIALGSTAFWI